MTDPAKDAERLAQCPFCGSTNIDPREWLRGDGKSGPGCSDCGATAESADAWNRRPIETRLTQERDAACKAHVECAESLDVAARERDEARRSAEALEAEVGRLCAERDAVVDDFASDCAAQPTPDDTEPSAEAREIADELLPKGFFADVRALLSYSLEDACEDKLRQDFALALDRYRAAERERCAKWAACDAHRDSPLVFNIRSGEPYDR